jgi:hypothetical protein
VFGSTAIGSTPEDEAGFIFAALDARRERSSVLRRQNEAECAAGSR